MEINTRAWLLSAIKYGDSSAILRFYSEELGYLSLMWKGAYSSRNKQKYLLQPLQEVEIQFRKKNEESLPLLKKIEPSVQRSTTTQNIAQNSLLLFVSEVLQSLLKNEPENEELYQLISIELMAFHQGKTGKMWIQNLFLKLTSILGCKPLNNYENQNVFDLESGGFSAESGIFALNLQDSILWHRFLSGNQTFFHTNERLRILEILLLYFEKQIPYFRFPKSLEIIKEVFYS